MQKKIFWSIFCTALTAMMTVGLCVLISIYGIFDVRLSEELRNEAHIISKALASVPSQADYLSSLNAENRVTLIAADGSVVFDSDAEADFMENHASRPEVVQAIAEGKGESRRYSDTMTEKTMYCAVRLTNGSVLRLASTERSLLGLVHRVVVPLALTLAVVAVMAVSLSRVLARRVTAPIAQLNLAAPLENDVYDELSPLLLRLEKQNDELREQLDIMHRQSRELTAITDSMREGLVLIDPRGRVLSVNRSAADIFSADPELCRSESYLSVNRSVELQNVVSSALDGISAEAQLKLDGRVYQLLGNPVLEKGIVRGIVVLILDVTERQEAEENRREFTANVSHELKTPLTSIVGFSEIMTNGLAKPEDMTSFAGRIHGEARRLIALIDDILRLSQLDEGANLPSFQSVDLMKICQDAAERLKERAKAAGVSITIGGEPASVAGIPKLLDEMVFNLTENAVKYNVPGGSVRLEVKQDASRVQLTVEDTGIGIPPEDQMRVFERFYRVDKSHSRETGGTGLGLSIVKHIAAIHHAEIALRSAPKKGSCFTVTFGG